jgi:ATP-dependent DNA helicase PIF1
MTLSSVEVDLPRVFDDGQAYVALSRVRSLEGLRLTSMLDANSVRCNPLVTEFYGRMDLDSWRCGTNV